MKAISVNQPWAWLIVQGFKDIENRDWATNYRGEVLIHTGKKLDKDFDYDFWEKVLQRPIPRDLFQGGVIGKVNIIDCVDDHHSPFFFGKYGFVLAEAQAFETPLPCKGALGFFTPDYTSRYVEPKRKKQHVQQNFKLV